MTVTSAFWRTASFGLLVAAELAAGVAVTAVATSVPASAQFFDERYPFLDPRSRRRGGFFDPYSTDERPPDFSRAPAAIPRKPDAAPVTTKILVLGNSMADWLAYGLDEALAETPEIGVIRKHKAFSGLIRYEAKPDAAEWPQIARELIAAEKPQAVIMMIGVQDRQAMREKIVAKPVEDKARRAEARRTETGRAEARRTETRRSKTRRAETGCAESRRDEEAGVNPDDDEQQPNIAAPEQQRGARTAGGLHEYHTEKWEELYAKRIDETIAALKSANIPVLWVGLPSIRGQKSTADALYLNEFYRARSEAAGILYVDVWDGFVDEQGRFSTRGPDFEGQMRILRAGDGVHFTKFGARKLAHYVERELRRVLSATPVALTTPEPAQQAALPAQPAKPAAPAQRPLAGPVFMLTTNADESDELLGGSGGARTPPASADPVASNVLVKGEAVVVAAGRADDYSWPPRMPNLKFSEPLPPSGSPVFMARPAQPRPAGQTAQAGGPGGTRVAGQQVLQGQIAPQQQGAFGPGGPRGQGQWRAPAPAYYGPSRGFFGLFR